MAVLTGGTVISEEMGRKLESAEIEDLGRARRVVASKEDTTKVEGHGTVEEIQNRISALKVQIGESTSDFDREKLQERMAKLAGGVAIIKVGAATEIELREKKLRVEDALSATRAAVEEGIVPGGGVVLVRASRVLGDVEASLKGDEATGVQLVRKAVDEPMKLIAANSGFEGAVVLNEIHKGQDDFGFDADKEVYGSMMELGIIDPAKVTRAALENGASVASMILTTEALVTDVPQDPSAAVAPPPMPEF